MILYMPSRVPAASIVVPTYREAANIQPLVERVFAAARGADIDAEMIIVDDDSRDGTAEIVERLQSEYPVRLVTRRNARGLASAVLEGFTHARSDRFLVLDADLQHPPEMIPAVLQGLGRNDCEFVMATRYDPKSWIEGSWPISRRLASRCAKFLARPLVAVSDPMSGFFALRRPVWERASRLDPIGYKIALELLVKGNCKRVAEIPIRFADRHAGQSKAGGVELVRYLRHLARLYRFRFPWGITTAIVLLFFLGIVCVVFFPGR